MASAKEYPTERIRNVAVVGHSKSGKSTLIDALAYVSGSIARRGDVGNGGTLTQYRDEELAHGMSIVATPAHAEWMNTKINLIDTPGYVDFAGEVEAAVRVADAGLLVVGARSGVGLGTVTAWKMLHKRGLPKLAFISKMDKEGANFDAAWHTIKERLDATVLPVEIPIGEGESFRGIINLFSGRAHFFDDGEEGRGEYREVEIPDELKGEYERWRTELLETIATTDESLLERYLEGDEITRDEAIAALAKAMREGDVVPAFCGSAGQGFGIRALLSKLVELMPSPAEAPTEVAIDSDGSEVTLHASDEGPLAALAFKTTSEPHVGELTYLKIVSGSVDNGAEVVNVVMGKPEKLSHLSIPQGRQRLEVPRLHAGDIGVIAKMRQTKTNHSLAGSAQQLRLQPVEYPTPDTRIALHGVDRKDEDKLGEALSKLSSEDPTFVAEFDPELRQTIARGLGDLHLQIQMEKLESRYHVKVETEQPKVAYRETIRQAAKAQGRHKKQTGGRGQFGDCHVELRPRGRGEGYEFTKQIVGGAIPGKFIPAVDKGIQEAAARGVIAGHPVVDFEAICYDGSHHAVDSSEMAFKVAGSLAFKAAVQAADPYLLEPVMEVEISIPNEAMGDVSGDIAHRRGRVQGMDAVGQTSILKALIPEAELFGYAAALRSMTHGRGHHTRRFSGYEEVPAHLAEKIKQEHAAAGS